jgi:UDP-N-acetylmuramoylalanine--D-glutamate ligase
MSLLTESLFQQYKDSQILILGLGKEGQSTYKLLRQVFPEKELFGMDKNGELAKKSNLTGLTFLPEYLQLLNSFDVVFKSPGISINTPELQMFLSKSKRITSQLNEFLRVYRGQVIGVTGTKGKSTTSALIHHILKSQGISSLLLGNIGIPVFDAHVTAATQLVVEMSSYQLENVDYSPHVAVLLNLYPEHLNYHQNFHNYLAAKAKIALFQTEEDFLIFNDQEPAFHEVVKESRAQLMSFSSQNASSFRSSSLLPTIQKNNLPAAIEVAKLFHISAAEAEAALTTFQPLAHRLEKVGTFRGVTFIDDTLATIPEAACEAVDAIPNVSVMMLGGFDRGIEYQKIVEKVIDKKIPTVIFFKPSGEKMAEIMKERYSAEQLPQIFFVDTMKDAVEKAYQFSQPGTTVLLSPASPSFGTFKDYEDKSAQFVKWVKELGKEK